MLIRCPTCASGYDLDPALLGGGRILRCAHCRDAWVHRAEADRTAAPAEMSGAAGSAGDGPSPGVEITAEASASRWTEFQVEKPEARRSIRSPSWRAKPWRVAASRVAAVPPRSLHWAAVALMVVSGLAAVAGKARVVAALPPSAAVFATLGLPVNLSGLALGEVRSAVATGDGPPVLTLEGRITNLRADATAVPALRIAVRDKSRRELYYWTAPAPKARLAAGETVLFRSRLVAPPRDGEEIAVGFAEAVPARQRVAEAMPGDARR